MRAIACPPPTKTAHARTLLADLAGFRNQLAAVCFWSRKCPKHSKKVTVRRDWSDAGNRTATSVLEKRLTRETERGVFFNPRSYYFMRAYAWSSNRHK